MSPTIGWPEKHNFFFSKMRSNHTILWEIIIIWLQKMSCSFHFWHMKLTKQGSIWNGTCVKWKSSQMQQVIDMKQITRWISHVIGFARPQIMFKLIGWGTHRCPIDPPPSSPSPCQLGPWSHFTYLLCIQHKTQNTKTHRTCTRLHCTRFTQNIRMYVSRISHISCVTRSVCVIDQRLSAP